MYRRSSKHIILGMLRDTSISKFNPNFSYENMNIRITAREDNTLLTVTNEKGNKLVEFHPKGDEIRGEYIGHSILGEYIVLFTLRGETSYIYKIRHSLDKNNDYKFDLMFATLLFVGNLNMDLNHPLETLAIYENKNILKVYWVDGKNQTRVINIANNYIGKPEDIFDFVRNIRQEHIVDISKLPQSTGSFPSGTVLYAITYFNKYAQESNIFYTSPLYYTTQGGRAGSPEETSSDSFKIELKELDSTFDYIRIYSIIHSSKDTEPLVKVVADLKIDNEDSVKYIDNNSKGEAIDPSLILYLGGEPVVFNTLEQKDNTLFLGNYSLDREAIPEEIKESLKGNSVKSFRKRYKVNHPETGEYPYKILLDNNRKDITYFKAREWYRLGIQLQHKSGKLSEPIYIGDHKMQIAPYTDLDIFSNFEDNYELQLPCFKTTLEDIDSIEKLKELGYTRARGVVVFPTEQERSVVLQGAVVPTVFNVEDRYKNMPFAQPSWVSRPVLNQSLKALEDDTYQKRYIRTTEIFGQDEPYRSIQAILSNKAIKDIATSITYSDMLKTGTRIESRHYNALIQGLDRGSEIQGLQDIPQKPFVIDDSKMGYILKQEHKEHDYTVEQPWVKGDYYVKLDTIDGELVNYPVYNSFKTYEELTQFFNDYYKILECIKSPTGEKISGLPTEEQLADDYPGVRFLLSVQQVLDIKSGEDFVLNYKNGFYVDLNILNIYSPDLTFNDNIHNFQNKELNFRIVGYAYATSNTSDYEILTTTKQGDSSSLGVYNTRIRTSNKSEFGFRKHLSNVMYMDYKKAYLTYAFHREGSLNGSDIPTGSSDRTGLLESKHISNISYCASTLFFDDKRVKIFDMSPFAEDSNYSAGVTPLHVWDYQNEGIIRIDPPKYSGLSQLNYSGSISRLLVLPQKGKFKKGYPIVSTKERGYDPSQLFDSDLAYINSSDNPTTSLVNVTTGKDPINISYKSGTHGVFSINYVNSESKVLNIFPTIDAVNFDKYNNRYLDENINPFTLTPGYPFWSKDKRPLSVYQGKIKNFFPEYSGYFIGEFYRDIDPDVIFGGKSEYALKNNLWFPAGEFVPLDRVTDIEYSQGDTYFLRYDHLVSYPTGKPTDKNNIVDILSFMCESRINMDGRYDKNRGQSNNLVMNPEIFNKMNDVYSQQDNFFNYRILDDDAYNLNDFPSSVTWSKTKSFGEDVDTWTNINLSNILDLDGDKGKLTSISKFNNELYAFLDKGISNILFNSRVQIPTEDGTPIEISNSNKVDGKRYIAQDIGCLNKFSLLPTKNGIYFVDNLSSELVLFNGSNTTSLSDMHGFRTLFNKVKTDKQWRPGSNNFITFRDFANGDIYFTTNEFCLGYSELLQSFTSFYSYENVPAMFNLGGKFYSIKDGEIWLQEGGKYNNFFGEFKPYYIDLVTNKRLTEDKIFTNVEFRGDMFNIENKLLPDCPFNHIHVHNEYQEGDESLENKFILPSNTKQKFRMWRLNIPRQNGSILDRIRNPWIRLRLSNNLDRIHDNKISLHDIKIYYLLDKYN